MVSDDDTRLQLNAVFDVEAPIKLLFTAANLMNFEEPTLDVPLAPTHLNM